MKKWRAGVFRRHLFLSAVAVGSAAACFDSGERGHGGELVVVDGLQLLEGDDLLHDVRDVYMDRDNRMWTLSGLPPFLRRFDADGTLMHVFGLQGLGPEELRSPWNFVMPSESSGVVDVWDSATSRFVRFDEDGNYLGATFVERFDRGTVLHHFRSRHYGRPGTPARLSEGYVIDAYAGTVVRQRDLWTARLEFLDANGNRRGRSVDLASLTNVDHQARDASTFESAPLWTVCAGGRIAALNPDSSRIEWFRDDASQESSWPYQLPMRSIDEEDARRYVWHVLSGIAAEEGIDTTTVEVRQEVEATLRHVLSELPVPAPVVRIRCDNVGRIWLELFDSEWDARGFSGEWFLLDRDKEAMRVLFPKGFHALHFGVRRIAGISVSALGVETPAFVEYPEMVMTGG